MKDRIMLKLLGSLILLLIGSSAVIANPYPPRNSWEFLGEKNIGHAYDKDVIYVRSSRDFYSAIELRTEKKQIDLHRCVIYYENGDRQDVKLRRDRRGKESHIIDLEGGARAIEKIAIWGSRDYGRVFKIFDKGTVEVWGKVANRRGKNNDSNYYSSNYDSNRDRDRNRDVNINWNIGRQNDYNRYASEQRRAQRDRERAQRDRQRAQRDRERAQRERERAQRERRRDNDRGRGGICPPRRP